MPHAMPSPPAELTSLRVRYDQYRAREINFFKEIVARRTIMDVADRARARLEARDELVLQELTLSAAVDEIIAERLRLPSFRAWARARERASAPRRRPDPAAPQFALAIRTGAPTLLLQARADDAWEPIVRAGGSVVVVEPDDEDRARVVARADAGGWSDMVQVAACYEEIDITARFGSVRYSPAACADFADWELEALIESLKARTVAGGVHVVEGLLQERNSAPRAVLRRGYGAWTRQVQRGSREWTLIASHPAPALVA